MKTLKLGKVNNMGFTIIELMIVVIIIGILVAVAVPVYTNSLEKTRECACFSNQKMINEASYQWHVKYGTSIKPYASNVQQLVDDGFLQKAPLCSGDSYNYIDPVTGLTRCPKLSEKHVLP